MPLFDLPQELTKTHWDKKKALPAGCALETQLKALQKKHDSVDWKPFDAGWAAQARSPADLDTALAALEKLYRSKVFPLKLEAGSVLTEAQKLAKDKAAGKPAQDAVRAITEAVKTYSKAVDDGLTQLAKEHAKALPALKKSAEAEADEDGGDDDDSALLDPKVLFKQLQLCRRDPARRVHFAFAGDNKTGHLCLSPRTAGRMLFAKLKDDTGFSVGAFGQAWVDGMTLYLSMDKPLSGLTKRVRPPLKVAGFKVSKVVLAGADGKAVEQDDEPDDNGAMAEPPKPGATAGEAMERLKARIKALEPGVIKVLQEGLGDTLQIKNTYQALRQAQGSGDAAGAIKALQQLEGLLASAVGSASAPPTRSQPPEPPPLPQQLQQPSGEQANIFKQRAAALTARLKELAVSNPKAAQALKENLASAAESAKKGDWTRASGWLDECDQIAGIRTGRSATPPSGDAQKDKTATVVYTQTRLAWDRTRKEVQTKLQTLEKALLAACANEPDFDQIAANTRMLYQVLDHLDERLIDKLDEALNAETPEARKAFKSEARDIIGDYLMYVTTDGFLRDIDDNGFVEIALLDTLTQRLTAMNKALLAA